MPREIAQLVLTLALPVGLPLLALTVTAGWMTSRTRRGRPTRTTWPVISGVIASLALIVSATLLRDLPGLVVGLVNDAGAASLGFPGSPFSWSPDGWDRLTYQTMGSQNLLNVALFAPAGASLTVLLGRGWLVTAALGTLSLVIECLQGILLVGAPDVADLASNGAGAALGAIAGASLVTLKPSLSRAGPPTRRRVLVNIGVVTALGAALVGVAVAGANHRQAVLSDRVAATFEGMDVHDLDAWLQQGRLEDELFEVGDVRSDGIQYDQDSTLVRYPAPFLGVQRCVFVQWTGDRNEVRPGSGAECPRFLG